ncbi:MAG: hypothetical protein ACU0DW_07960 [Shimia sp.]
MTTRYLGWCAMVLALTVAGAGPIAAQQSLHDYRLAEYSILSDTFNNFRPQEWRGPDYPSRNEHGRMNELEVVAPGHIHFHDRDWLQYDLRISDLNRVRPIAPHGLDAAYHDTFPTQFFEGAAAALLARAPDLLERSVFLSTADFDPWRTQVIVFADPYLLLLSYEFIEMETHHSPALIRIYVYRGEGTLPTDAELLLPADALEDAFHWDGETLVLAEEPPGNPDALSFSDAEVLLNDPPNWRRKGSPAYEKLMEEDWELVKKVILDGGEGPPYIDLDGVDVLFEGDPKTTVEALRDVIQDHHLGLELDQDNYVRISDQGPDGDAFRAEMRREYEAAEACLQGGGGCPAYLDPDAWNGFYDAMQATDVVQERALKELIYYGLREQAGAALRTGE